MISPGPAVTPAPPMTALRLAAATLERQWLVDEQLDTLVADLRRNDERTQFALATARTGLWEAELSTRLVEWSDTMHLAIGHLPSSFDGTLEGMRDLLHPEDREKFASLLRGPFDAPRNFRIQVRVPWPDGSVHHVQLIGQVAPDPGGTSVRLVSVAQDITEQWELESKLRQAQKMEAMGRLAGGVAHDFNNILTAILGYAMLIETEPGNSAAAALHAAEIRKASERAAALTKQLLAFSRRQVVEQRAIQLDSVINDVLPMLRQIAGEQVHIEHDVTAGAHAVLADPAQLQQVILNLAVNARDAMPNGGRLTIRARNRLVSAEQCLAAFTMAPGEYVVLTIGDTGTGIDAATQSRMFEPFFTTKDAAHGTGLGLSTVLEIVNGLHGGISVSSELGVGTTFDIYLPRTSAVDPGVAVAAPVAALKGSETLLLVEDEDAVRILVQEILGRKGYTVLAAADAAQAHAHVASSRTPIPLILTDVMMPDSTGPELIASLQTGAAAGARALYMSGYGGAVLAKQGRLAADCEFIQKPFTGPDLLRKIRHLLDSAAPAQATSR